MDKHSDCIKDLEESQKAEHDNRQMVREADHFLNKRDGQWETNIIKKFSGKPRYTFDEINPIVDDIMGEMGTADFDIRVNPSGDESSKDTANLFEGIIRNIENISGARFVYNYCARSMIGTGFSAWRIIQAYLEPDSFYQDLIIKPVPCPEDSIWFDPNATMQDMSDAKFCWRVISMTYDSYKKKYPKGSGLSIGDEIRNQAYYYKKPDEVKIGEYIYLKRKKRKIALLSDYSVVPIDDDFEKVKDEMEASGKKIEDTRDAEYYIACQRHFDGGDWLTEEEETVFTYLPIIPVYGNFKISENKVIYRGITEKLMDAQRVINYSESRKIEEGAFSGRGKYWLTLEQMANDYVQQTLQTMNTNTIPVQPYVHVDGQPVPFYQPSPPSNPGLIETTQTAQNFVQRVSGTFDESRGTAPAQRSGFAIDKLQQKSDNPKRKWFTSMEIALAHTCRVLIKSIPKVYNARSVVRLVNQDGTIENQKLNDVYFDNQTQKWVWVNDLSKGQYDVVVSAGPAFHSRQQETVTAINEIAALDPTIMQIGSDVLLNNIASPGIDEIAERKRAMMVQQGLIPPTQQTDEEKKVVAQQQQAQANKPPDPSTLLAQAEMAKAQVKGQEAQLKAEIEQQKTALKQIELQTKTQIEQQKIEQANNKQIGEAIKAMADQVKTQAETLKIIKETMGADTVIEPNTIQAYKGQAEDLNRSIQDQQS